MPRANGTRFAAVVCFLLSFTIILAPITFPLGWFLLYKARQKEKERKQELEHMEKLAENVDSS